MGERSPPSPPLQWVRVVLVGFMGAGKSRIGRETSQLLGWSFVDVDHEIEMRSGRGVDEIFRTDGEAAFRALEGRVTAELLERERVVVSTGGGWPAAAPDRMASLDGGTLSVWLRISAEDAVHRIVTGRGRVRPLLQVPDPVAEARRLIALREPYYQQARMTVDAGRMAPRATARRIRDRVLEMHD